MNRFRRQSGAAAVEFAVVLPLLIILVFGIIAFGIAFAQELALSNAARQGARFGVVQDRTCQDVVDEVQGSGGTIGMLGTDIDVEISRSGFGTITPCSGSTPVCEGGDGQSLVVTATHSYQLTVPLVLDSSKTLEGVGVFRCEST